MTNAILDGQASTVSLSDELVISWWTDWHRFLELRQQRLDTRSSAVATPGFDLDENDPAHREQQINEWLAVIPVARRTVFEAELEAKRHEIRIEREAERNISAAEVDLQAVERDAINELLDIARGNRDEGRLAAVPTGEGVWYDVDPDVVNRVPDAETYAIAGKRRGPSRNLVMYGGIALIWVVVGIAYYFTTRPQAVAAPVVAPATVNERPLEAWTVRALRLGEREMPVEQLDTATWPKASGGAAGWQAGSVWPMRFCVSLAEGETLPSEMVLLGRDINMDRTLAISTQAPTIAAVEIAACGTGNILGYGALRQTTPQTFAAVGDAQALPAYGDVTLEDVRVIGRGQDASIAEGQAQVVIRLLSPAGLDWPRFVPSLVLASGDVRPGNPRASEDGVEIVYEVAAPAVPVAAAWQFVDPDTGAAYRWRVTLTPPRSRRAELAATTRFAVSSATWENGQLSVNVTVTNIGEGDMTLYRTDFLATQAGQVIDAQPFTEQGRVIPAGKDSEMTLTVFANPSQTTLLYLGERGVSIQPPATVTTASGQ